MLTYEQALRIVFRHTDLELGDRPPYAERIWRLERMNEFLHALGDPQLCYPAVHVAGTKGKGSTTAMIASILQTAGLRTGMYTSPHLHSFRERIQLDGELIPEEAMAGLVERMAPVIAERPEVTVFEIITALAMLYYAEAGVDWAVFEVGLGGRLDATNVLHPRVSVITSISLDHMAVLGPTVGHIAREKAGIIKPGVPVISAPQQAEALSVIADIAAERGAPLTLGGRDWQWRSLGDAGHEMRLYRTGNEQQPEYPALAVPLRGEHQLENATNAALAIEALRAQGLAVSRAEVAAGIASVRWPGRFEVLQHQPPFVVDGAHNVDSMQKLLRTVEAEFPEQRPVVIFGAGRGHIPTDLLVVLAGHVARLYLVKANHPKAAEVAELSASAQALGIEAIACATVDEGVERALASARPEEVVLATGSLFVVAEARRAWLAHSGLSLPPGDPPGVY
ncbi:MAG: folylpolyglutamate synthase/dihydrofolate synthase family protein [Anaerolineales bacterium]